MGNCVSRFTDMSLPLSASLFLNMKIISVYLNFMSIFNVSVSFHPLFSSFSFYSVFSLYGHVLAKFKRYFLIRELYTVELFLNV